MCFKRIARWFGRRIGWLGKQSWEGVKAVLKWFGVLLLIIVGSILTFMGQFVLLSLGALVAICIFFLRAFAWVTEKLMITTKWFGTKLSEFTENFYQGVTSIFKEEEELLNQEIQIIVTAKKL